jgi:hypothetical protein
MITSPISVIVDKDGYDVAIAPGGSYPSSPRGFLTIGIDSTNTPRTIKLNSDGYLQVSGLSLLATESTLSSFSSTYSARTPTLGQKAMTGSVPVVIASDQNAVPISGSITANIGTTNGLALDATLTGGTQISKIGNGSITAQLLASNPAGTENALVVRNIPSGTQTVSGTITAAQSTAANLNATVIGSGSAGTPASGVITVQGISGGTVIPVSGSITANIGTTNGLSLDTTLTGGSQKTKITDGTNVAAVINTNPSSEYGLVVRTVGLSQVEPVVYEQHTLYGTYTSSGINTDQLVCSYTVPTGKTLLIINYMFSSGTSSTGANPAKIGKETLAETSSPGTTDSNIFRCFFLSKGSVFYESLSTPSYSVSAGQVLKATVTPDSNGSTIWRVSITFILK